MALRNSFAIFLFSAVAGLGAPRLDVMPYPASVRLDGASLEAAGKLLVVFSGEWDARTRAAAARAAVRWSARIGRAAAVGRVVTLTIASGRAGPAALAEGDDESYVLRVTGSGVALSAPNDLGVLHGLETLLQLLHRDESGWRLPRVEIDDRPRFPWRGLMIDVARRWQPLPVIERNIDAMAVVKLNVLHLHLTDDQGFRIESLTHPELQAKGSDGLYFTQGEMRRIIAYAGERGIRVVPEFDIPGHATSWVASHPELASLPGPYGIERQWGVFDPALDPTKEGTYALLKDFLGEMAALFPDAFIHIGGDENNGVQWNANPQIQAFIASRGLKDDAGLHAYFNARIGAILTGLGKRLVGWDEILNPALPRASVIDSWRGTDALAKASVLGYEGILANGFYIDLMHPASEHYLADPLPSASTLTPAQGARVLGGEATMWSEWVTPETIDSRIWPRTAAIAERLWSAPGERDVPEMYRRLDVVSERLAEAGSLHEANQDLMLRHLVGENLRAAGVGELRVFLSLIEPVKVYSRGRLQVWANQLMPLVGIADAALPESEPSRGFAAATDRLLFAGSIDRSQATVLAGNLSEWSSAGKTVQGLADHYPALREAVVPARNLEEGCLVGVAAARSLASGNPLSAAQLAASIATLDRCSQDNPSATELPLLRPIRLLVVAAARQALRPLPGEAGWSSRIQAEAFPPVPSTP